MKNWQSALIPSSATFRQAIEVIDNSALQVGLVVDENRRLLGMVTDGTIRRAILHGVSMDENIQQVMFSSFLSASVTDTREQILATMQKEEIRHIPLLDENGVIHGLRVLIDLLNAERKDNIVVLMAGGMGTRLRPLTERCPKPLLKVGDRPILETILQSFTVQGFHKFYFSVNYCSEMIKEYFGNGDKWDVSIQYIEETEPLGTAGALSLLPVRPELPFFVMNGDLLTKIDFEKLIEFHSEHETAATMCVRQYDYQIPYGVVRFEGVNLKAIDEKPIHKFFVNAGIYALSPESLDCIPKDQFFDMPSLFDVLGKKKIKTTVFPVREYWMDIGQMKDFERANGEYCVHFANGDQN
ncbi:nucleotidyltransferase family protein [Desulfoplanes sp. PS50]